LRSLFIVFCGVSLTIFPGIYSCDSDHKINDYIMEIDIESALKNESHDIDIFSEISYT